MEELIAILFLSREFAHREHLKTDSYAEHMALGSFYEDIIPLADRLAEAHQGRTGKRLGEIPYYSNPLKGSVTASLKKLLVQVENGKEELEGIDEDTEDSTIENIIDEIIALYLSTIYKLTFLK